MPIWNRPNKNQHLQPKHPSKGPNKPQAIIYSKKERQCFCQFPTEPTNQEIRGNLEITTKIKFFDEIRIIQPEIPSQQPASLRKQSPGNPPRNQSEEAKNTLGVRRDDGILLSRPAVAHLSTPPPDVVDGGGSASLSCSGGPALILGDAYAMRGRQRRSCVLFLVQWPVGGSGNEALLWFALLCARGSGMDDGGEEAPTPTP